jgi:hypothetical protein
MDYPLITLLPSFANLRVESDPFGTGSPADFWPGGLDFSAPISEIVAFRPSQAPSAEQTPGGASTPQN